MLLDRAWYNSFSCTKYKMILWILQGLAVLNMDSTVLQIPAVIHTHYSKLNMKILLEKNIFHDLLYKVRFFFPCNPFSVDLREVSCPCIVLNENWSFSVCIWNRYCSKHKNNQAKWINIFMNLDEYSCTPHKVSI